MTRLRPGARIRCVVPHCNRTRVDDGAFDEWICGDHWRLVERMKRRVYGRIMKRWRRFRAPEDDVVGRRIWSALKRLATERAAGI